MQKDIFFHFYFQVIENRLLISLWNVKKCDNLIVVS